MPLRVRPVFCGSRWHLLFQIVPGNTYLKKRLERPLLRRSRTVWHSINRDILGWYNFYSIYPISKELYNLIKDNGIEEVAVEGVAPIIIK